MPRANPRFICPKCGYLSFSAADVLHGYCVRCQRFFNPRDVGVDPELVDFALRMLLAEEIAGAEFERLEPVESPARRTED